MKNLDFDLLFWHQHVILGIDMKIELTVLEKREIFNEVAKWSSSGRFEKFIRLSNPVRTLGECGKTIMEINIYTQDEEFFNSLNVGQKVEVSL